MTASPAVAVRFARPLRDHDVDPICRSCPDARAGPTPTGYAHEGTRWGHSGTMGRWAGWRTW